MMRSCYSRPSGQFIIGGLIVGFLLGPYGCTALIQNPALPPPLPVLKESSERTSNERDKPKSPEVIKPGDILVITIWEHPEMSRERTVSPEGFLRLPLLGGLKVTNLTAEELENTLKESMVRYLKNPVISVEIKEAPLQQTITLLGAVNKPGKYQFPTTEEVKLSSLIGTAGGYLDSAKLENVSVFRTEPSNSNQREKFQVDLKNILFDPDALDVTLRNKDIVFIEPTETNNWNKTLGNITPTLALIGLILGTVYLTRQMR